MGQTPIHETAAVFPEKWRSLPIQKSLLQKSLGVIPAEAGIQVFNVLWTPAFAGVTEYRMFCKSLDKNLYLNRAILCPRALVKWLAGRAGMNPAPTKRVSRQSVGAGFTPALSACVFGNRSD